MQTQTNYQKVASYEAQPEEINKVVLLFSGGLDTSIILKWIQDTYNKEVIALTLDIGQQRDDLEAVKQKALSLGAAEAIVLDIKDEFAEKYLAQGIKANASYQGDYHLSTPMGRAICAVKAVEIAHKYQANCIAHGCTGKGNDQVRFESYILTHDADMKIIAPVREWDMTRTEQLAYAQKHNIPVPASVDSPYSDDDNMWGMTWEGGEIEEPELIAPEEKFLTVHTLAKNAPDNEELVTLTFAQGIPTEINDQPMRLAQLISHLNDVGGAHGVGVAYMFEDRLVGVKNGGIYDQPGAHMIIKAHQSLERFVSTRQLNQLKTELDIKWGYLCYGSLWFDQSMAAINAFNDYVNQKVTGKVTLRLYKGTVTVVAMESAYGLSHASFEKTGGYNFNVNASAGFIEIYGLQMKIAHQVEAENKKQ